MHTLHLLTLNAHLNSEGISYVLMYDDPASGLIVERTRGRPSNTEKLAKEREVLKCTEETEKEIDDLRTELGFSRQSKIVLMLSIASDEMIRYVMMYPEVFFMDVTGGVNRQKRDFFLIAIKDAMGFAFTANITSIPSGRPWVYLSIYRFVLPWMYGKETIERNRLALTDEDICEYQTFEACIQTDEIYKKSKLGLCSFHALWKPYKQSIKPLLPKSGDSITEVGKEYGVLFSFSYSSSIEPFHNSYAISSLNRKLANGLVIKTCQ